MLTRRNLLACAPAVVLAGATTSAAAPSAVTGSTATVEVFDPNLGVEGADSPHLQHICSTIDATVSGTAPESLVLELEDVLLAEFPKLALTTEIPVYRWVQLPEGGWELQCSLESVFDVYHDENEDPMAVRVCVIMPVS